MEINAIELASNLAHGDVLNMMHVYDIHEEDELYQQDGDSLIYKEEIQDEFDELYDYYFNMIIECAI